MGDATGLPAIVSRPSVLAVLCVAAGFALSIFLGPAVFVLGAALTVVAHLQRGQTATTRRAVVIAGCALMAGSAIYLGGGVLQALASSDLPNSGTGSVP